MMAQFIHDGTIPWRGSSTSPTGMDYWRLGQGGRDVKLGPLLRMTRRGSLTNAIELIFRGVAGGAAGCGPLDGPGIAPGSKAMKAAGRQYCSDFPDCQAGIESTV